MLKQAGISTSVAHRCEQVADVPEQRFLVLSLAAGGGLALIAWG